MTQQLSGDFLRSVAAVFDSFHEKKSLEVAMLFVVALWVDVAGGVVSQRERGEGSNGDGGVSARLRVVLAGRRE